MLCLVVAQGALNAPVKNAFGDGLGGFMFVHILPVVVLKGAR